MPQRVSKCIAGEDPGGGGRSPLPIEMAPLGIMPPSEIRCRPSGLEWCRPIWRVPKNGQRNFSSKVVPKRSTKIAPVPKKLTKIALDTSGRLSTPPSGPCRPRGPGIMPPSDRRPPAYENPGSAPAQKGIRSPSTWTSWGVRYPYKVVRPLTCWK